jgi:hypothetical protein
MVQFLYILFFKVSVLAVDSPCCLFSAYQEPLPCHWSGWGKSLATHLYLVLWLIMSNTIFSLSQYACMACRGKALHFLCLLSVKSWNIDDFDNVAATTITFSFVGPADNGGQPVRKYAVQYKEERKDWRDARNKTWPAGMYPLWSKLFYSWMI